MSRLYVRTQDPRRQNYFAAMYKVEDAEDTLWRLLCGHWVKWADADAVRRQIEAGIIYKIESQLMPEVSLLDAHLGSPREFLEGCGGSWAVNCMALVKYETPSALWFSIDTATLHPFDQHRTFTAHEAASETFTLRRAAEKRWNAEFKTREANPGEAHLYRIWSPGRPITNDDLIHFLARERAQYIRTAKMRQKQIDLGVGLDKLDESDFASVFRQSLKKI